MLLSAVSVLVVAQSSSEIPEGLMNNPVFKDVDFSISVHFLHHIRVSFLHHFTVFLHYFSAFLHYFSVLFTLFKCIVCTISVHCFLILLSIDTKCLYYLRSDSLAKFASSK